MAVCWKQLLLLLWLFLAVEAAGAASDEVPHISHCNFCQQCDVDAAPPVRHRSRNLQEMQSEMQALLHHLQSQDHSHHTPSRTRRLRQLDPATDDPKKPPELRWSSYMATANDVVPKQLLPNCTRCHGCNTELSFMAADSHYFNRTYTNERGATSSWLFRASTARVPSGQAVVKVYCMPIPKRPGARVPSCSPLTVLRTMMLMMALERISQDCGLDDILPNVWVDRIEAVVPGIGFHIRWYGLWMELIPGISLENFLHKGDPKRLPPEQVLDIMHHKLNKSQVVRAAIFDLLTSQCDRHAQNIFIDEEGRLRLIDNEACLQNSWKNCGFDSVLVPTTQKQEIVRMSNQFIAKLVPAHKAPHGNADPQLLLDYRCYLEGNDTMGTNYPPQVDRCLRKISTMTVAEVEQHYQLPSTLTAHNCTPEPPDMLTNGFEWAAKFGEPRNAPPKRYMIQPKCCQIKWEHDRYRCAHEWKPVFEIPIGNPNTGREWTKARPDTGTYEGGTRY
ncbi:hypothetical protein V8C86DRAFT_2686314 [Haematococcus lacustris]